MPKGPYKKETRERAAVDLAGLVKGSGMGDLWGTVTTTDGDRLEMTVSQHRSQPSPAKRLAGSGFHRGKQDTVFTGRPNGSHSPLTR